MLETVLLCSIGLVALSLMAYCYISQINALNKSNRGLLRQLYELTLMQLGANAGTEKAPAAGAALIREVKKKGETEKTTLGPPEMPKKRTGVTIRQRGT